MKEKNIRSVVNIERRITLPGLCTLIIYMCLVGSVLSQGSYQQLKSFGLTNFVAGSRMFAESGNQSQEWVWRNPLPQANDLRGVTASTNRFVAVGSLGVILVSGDGTHWVHSSSPTRNLLSS